MLGSTPSHLTSPVVGKANIVQMVNWTSLVKIVHFVGEMHSVDVFAFLQ